MSVDDDNDDSGGNDVLLPLSHDDTDVGAAAVELTTAASMHKRNGDVESVDDGDTSDDFASCDTLPITNNRPFSFNKTKQNHDDNSNDFGQSDHFHSSEDEEETKNKKDKSTDIAAVSPTSKLERVRKTRARIMAFRKLSAVRKRKDDSERQQQQQQQQRQQAIEGTMSKGIGKNITHTTNMTVRFENLLQSTREKESLKDAKRRRRRTRRLDKQWSQSTGSLMDSVLRNDHSVLKTSVSSLLDLTQDIDEDSMQWRRHMINDHSERMKIVQAMTSLKQNNGGSSSNNNNNTINISDEFAHPLHVNTGNSPSSWNCENNTGGSNMKARSDEIEPMLGDVASVLGSSSVSSDASFYSQISGWFTSSSVALANGVRPKRRLKGGKPIVRVRRFMDFTPDNQNEPNNSTAVVYEEHQVNNDSSDHLAPISDIFMAQDDENDSDSETVCSYIIPVKKKKSSKSGDSHRSIARNFLDLTRDEELHFSTRSLSFVFGPTVVDGSDGGTTTISTEAPDEAAETDEQNEVEVEVVKESQIGSSEISNSDSISALTNHTFLLVDDTSMSSSTIDSESRDLFNSAAWEHADTAFIQSVHDIANNLELRMKEQGLESPFWPADTVFPAFSDFHGHVYQKLADSVRERKKSPEVGTEAGTDQELNTHEGDDTGGIEEKKFGPFHKPFRGAQKLRHKMERFLQRHRSSLDEDEEENEDEKASKLAEPSYENVSIQSFLYQHRHGGSVVLPSVIGLGLDKRLSESTFGAASEIIESLTDPLRSRRKCSEPPPMETVTEEDDEQNEDKDEEEQEGKYPEMEQDDSFKGDDTTGDSEGAPSISKI